MAACAARPPVRSTGIVPVPVQNILTSQPLSPLPVKYSALATNVTFRLTTSGMKIESEKERWLLARIAGPVSGTCSSPSTTGRKTTRSQGPSRTYFSSQYSSTGSLSPRSVRSLRSSPGGAQRGPGPAGYRGPGPGRVHLPERGGSWHHCDQRDGDQEEAGSVDGHRGRRDNGLDARDFAAVGDLDPRVGEHLLDVLGAQGIAAYLQPSMDVNPVTRDTQIPARPVDRLYADRAHLSVARDYLRRLVAEEEAAAHRAGPPGPDDTRDPAPGPVAGTPDVADPTTGPVEGRAPRSSQRPASGGPERPGRRPPAGRPPGPPPPRPPEQSSTVDATFEGIVAGFDATVAPGPAPWPAA